MQIDHECSQRAFHARQFALKRYETCARNTRSGFEIHQPHRLADGDVILRIVDPARRAYFCALNIAVLIRAVGHITRGQVRQCSENVVQLFRKISFLRAFAFDRFLQARDDAHQALRFFLILLRLGCANLLGRRIARRFSFLLGGLRRAQLRIERQDRTGLRRHPAPRPRCVIRGGIVPDGLNIVHV